VLPLTIDENALVGSLADPFSDKPLGRQLPRRQAGELTLLTPSFDQMYRALYAPTPSEVPLAATRVPGKASETDIQRYSVPSEEPTIRLVNDVINNAAATVFPCCANAAMGLRYPVVSCQPQRAKRIRQNLNPSSIYI
jgi:hypothetical protein